MGRCPPRTATTRTPRTADPGMATDLRGAAETPRQPPALGAGLRPRSASFLPDIDQATIRFEGIARRVLGERP